MKHIRYNGILPISGVVKVPDDYCEDDLNGAIIDDCVDAVKYNLVKTIQGLEVVDSEELEVNGHEVN
tara:strand:+ start:400 stop:600 length:201 start_codon:yes stop_codon:yes gene_type:complete